MTKFGCFVLVVGVSLAALQGSLEVARASQVLDAHLQEVSAGTFATVDLAVPKSVIANLCGDTDGCSVRLLGYTLIGSFRHVAEAFADRSLTTDPAGSAWISYLADTPVTVGSTADAVSGNIVEFSLLSGTCSFRDDSSSNGYVLSARSLSPTDGVLCVLRIAD